MHRGCLFVVHRSSGDVMVAKVFPVIRVAGVFDVGMLSTS
jgi:hypothetical protein